MSWKQIGASSRPDGFFQWKTPLVIEGIWKGTTPGEYGDVGQMETAEGFVSFPMTAVLTRDLTEVEEGRKVRLEYLGKKIAQRTGRPYHAFHIFIEEEG